MRTLNYLSHNPELLGEATGIRGKQQIYRPTLVRRRKFYMMELQETADIAADIAGSNSAVAVDTLD